MRINRKYVSEAVDGQRKFYEKLNIIGEEKLGGLEKTASIAIAEVMETLVEATNSSMISTEQMAESMFRGIQNQHNFLQGELWLAMEKTIRKYSEMEYVDGRNAFAKEMCGAFIKGNDERTG